MRSYWKSSLWALLPAALAGVVNALPLEAADPFGRIDRAAIEPAPQIFVNPYAAPAPAKLPSMRLAALGQVVRVDRLSEAYRAATPQQAGSFGQAQATPAAQTSPPGQLPAVQVPAAYSVAPATYPTTRPLAPAANAPASIPYDRQVMPASYGAPFPVAAGSSDSTGNPLRSAAVATGSSGNPLR
jgi:hypothetical protein